VPQAALHTAQGEARGPGPSTRLQLGAQLGQRALLALGQRLRLGRHLLRVGQHGAARVGRRRRVSQRVLQRRERRLARLRVVIG